MVSATTPTSSPSADTLAAAKGTPAYLIVLIVITTTVALLAGVYFSGYADDAIEFVMVKFFKAKAKAEMKAMEVAGEGAAQDLLKDQLKKNPVVDAGELDQVADGLGQEKLAEFGKGGGLGKGLKL